MDLTTSYRGTTSYGMTDPDGRRTIYLGKELDNRLIAYLRVRAQKAEFARPSASAVIRVALQAYLDEREKT